MQQVKSRKSVKNTDYYKGAAMKNWKFIKVENKDTPELREKLRDIDEQIKNWEHAKGIDGVEKANAQKTIDDLKKERSKIQQEITTGNTAHSDKVEVIKRLLAGGWSVEDIYSLLKTEGYEVEKNFIEKLKTGNESIGKKEWSMFKGLSKDAEKEVGNAYTPNPELIKVLEAWLHNRMSEQEAREKIMKITGDKNITDMMIHSPGGFIPVGNKGQWDSKKMVYAKWDEGKGRPSEEFAKITWLGDGKGGLVNVWKGSQMTSEKFGSNDLEELRRWAEQRIGNESIGDEYNAEIYRLEKKKMDLERMGQGQKAREIEKQIQQLQKELREYEIGNKKIGNNLKKVRNSKLGWWKLKDGTFAELKHDGRVIYYGTNRGYIEAQEKYDDSEEAEGTLEISGAKYVGNQEQNSDNLCRARNAIKTKNGMGVSDLEAQIRKNKEFIRQQKMRMNGKSKPEQDDIAEGIREAEEEIDRMEMRIAELKETGNKKVGNRKAIGSHFDMNDYGIEVGQWSWDWKGSAPDRKTMQDIARKIKDYARQIDRDVPEGDSDERDEVFAKLDRFMQTQGLK